MKSTVRLACASFGLTVLAACSGGAAEEGDDVEVSSDLLTADVGFSDDVIVAEDHLELPLAGHEDVLAYAPGKILAGGPSSRLDSETNPHGFLRRVEAVRRDGDRIVIATSRAALEDVFKGRVTIESEPTTLAEEPEVSGGLAPQARWQGQISRRVDIPRTPLFTKELSTGPVRWDVEIGVSQGYVDFNPSITTKIELGGGSLEELKVVAVGNVHADVGVYVNVDASNPTDAESGLQTFEKTLYTSPRVRFSQLVGVVPVWESLEARLVVRCGVRVRGSVRGELRFDADAWITAGGEYRKGRGIDGILEGPTFDMTPRWSASVAGNVYAKCALQPEISLYVYDLAGPTLSVGPYAEGSLTRGPAGPTAWRVQPGFRADFGGRVTVFGHDVWQGNVTLLDRKFGGPYEGTLPF